MCIAAASNVIRTGTTTFLNMQALKQGRWPITRHVRVQQHVCVIAPQRLPRTQQQARMAPPRHAADPAVEPSSEDVSNDDAMQYERIAQALFAKLKDLPDLDEGEQLEAETLSNEQLLAEWGGSRSSQQLQERRAASSTASTSSSTTTSSTTSTRARGPRLGRGKQLPMESLPKVAIVGRPNVGKSAMFNRIAGSSLAVVYDYPGVTRDRLYTRAFWGDTEFVLIDTGGLMSDATRLPLEQQTAAMRSISAEGLPAAIERQAAAGVAEADVVVLLVDGQAGLQPGDREILDWLRQKQPGKKVVLGVNKCESTTKADMQAAEFWELGLQPHPVSAISGTGTGELMDALVTALPPPSSWEPESGEEAPPLAVAIVGRPNVGKSSMLNAICGEERAIVCDMSGTTRDAVDTKVTLPSGQQLTLIDTAGIRKRARVADSKDGAEQLSVDRAVRAVSRADVVVVVVDASEGVTQQDFRLSELIARQGCAVVIAVNKWDRVDPKLADDQQAYIDDVKAQLRHVGWAGVVCTNARRGRGVPEVLEAVLKAGEQHRRRVSTATLNMVVREAVSWKAPPSQRGSGRQGRVYYATQAASQPPTFVLFVNDPRLFSEDYRRYMERAFRDNMGFEGTPLRLWYRGKGLEGGKGGSGSSGGRRGSGGGGRGGGRSSGSRQGKSR